MKCHLPTPHPTLRTPHDDPHLLHRRPVEVPRARGRHATSRWGSHVRRRPEAAVGASHPRRRAQPHPPGAAVPVCSGRERAFFLADLAPTSAHLPLPWIMGYDLEPLVTLESKRHLYRRAEGEGWLLVFEHDPAVVAGRLGKDGKAFGLVDPVRLG